jgi:hypothetical protein
MGKRDFGLKLLICDCLLSIFDLMEPRHRPTAEDMPASKKEGISNTEQRNIEY